MRRYKKFLCLVLLTLTLIASGQPVSRIRTFAWDPSPDPGVTYYLFGNRTPGRSRTGAQIGLPCGTNLFKVVMFPAPGVWYVTVVANRGRTFSVPSNEVTVTIE